ncbi:hypothetical protein J7E78_21945 [Paenibacillus polymyxa]|uniref:hypothetical protein n=1 Tax=Paenibacillus polymyxa TaxID=1406 RepID=UPI001BE6DC11|nr:hypothetical protein [Paenibacillus polymyxa]MBT2286202.1 hypothetical protein [Paenibacillus polymyxa]
MTWLIEPGIVLLIIIGVIWLLIRSDRQRHHRDQGRHPIRRSNSYTDSTSGSPVIIGDDSHERHSRHSFDHRHPETDSHHHSSDSSSSDSGGDSSGGDSGGGGD